VIQTALLHVFVLYQVRFRLLGEGHRNRCKSLMRYTDLHAWVMNWSNCVQQNMLAKSRLNAAK